VGGLDHRAVDGVRVGGEDVYLVSVPGGDAVEGDGECGVDGSQVRVRRDGLPLSEGESSWLDPPELLVGRRRLMG
jgi:hypothetical protein